MTAYLIRRILQSLIVVWLVTIFTFILLKLLPGGPVATRMANPAGTATGLLPPDVMAAPIVWLASDASDHVTGRRFIAARWNSALTDAQAAQAAGAPAAWAAIATAASGRQHDGRLERG